MTADEAVVLDEIERVVRDRLRANRSLPQQLAADEDAVIVEMIRAVREGRTWSDPPPARG